MKLSTSGMAGITVLLGLAFTSALFAAESGAAEPGNGARQRGFEGGRSPSPGIISGRRSFRGGPALERQLERMDANDDAEVSEEEFLAFRLSRLDELFERRDRDDDGLISLQENERRGRHGRFDLDRDEVIACVRETIADFAPNADTDRDREQRFEDVDLDGNGSLTLAEVSAALQTRAHETFARIDADVDGLITRAELKARHQAQLNVRRTIRECMQERAQV